MDIEIKIKTQEILCGNKTIKFLNIIMSDTKNVIKTHFWQKFGLEIICLDYSILHSPQNF